MSESYKTKYETLLQEVSQALQEGTVLSDKFRKKIRSRQKALAGDASIDYKQAESGDLITE